MSKFKKGDEVRTILMKNKAEIIGIVNQGYKIKYTTSGNISPHIWFDGELTKVLSLYEDLKQRIEEFLRQALKYRKAEAKKDSSKEKH